MQKLCKKSLSTTNKKLGATSFIRSRGDNITNEMWQSTCQDTLHKFNRIEVQHNALQPASPAFLKNYDDIDWHRDEPWDDSVTPNPPKNPNNVPGKTKR